MHWHRAIWATIGGWATIVGLCAAPMALAEPVFAPPAGCTLTMTVQMHSCQVANYYSCAQDPEGDRWVSFADGEGEYFLSHTDAETRWIESTSLADGEVEQLDAGASADNASFSALLATGRDDYDFITQSSQNGVQRFLGHDQLTGESIRIDGVELERCAFEMRIEDGLGGFVASRRGMQLVSRDMRIFFSDTETYENAFGDKASSAQGPVSFAFPGDAGFAAIRPEYDCDMMMTQLDVGQP